MSKTTQLDKVSHAFEHWRNNKPRRGSLIPQALRQQAVSLLSDYPAAQICKILSISGSQFKKWRQADNPHIVPTQFIELGNSAMGVPASNVSLEINFTNGQHMQLSGEFDAQFVTQLIEAVKT